MAAANSDIAQSELDMAAANSLLGIAASPFGKNKGPANVRRFLLAAQHLNLEIVDKFSSIGSNVLLGLSKGDISEIAGGGMNAILVSAVVTTWKLETEKDSSRQNHEGGSSRNKRAAQDFAEGLNSGEPFGENDSETGD
jgi:hypothetical protein